MQKTGIEYLTHTWNPICMRCTPVSEGCVHCWHLRMCDRMAYNPNFSKARREIYAGAGKPELVRDELLAPMRLKKPSVIGVQFMGDLFHREIPFWMIDDVFEAMLRSGHHTYIVLTKRPDVLYAWADSTGNRTELIEKTGAWIGITVENQARFDQRWEYANKIPAAVVWVSHEPALGPITYPQDFLGRGQRAWVVTGGETGPGARPMHPDWVRHDRDQCQAAGVPFFFKQWGEWAPNWLMDSQKNFEKIPGSEWMDKMGRKSAGHLLDGREWREMP